MARVKQGRYKGLPKNDVLIAKAMANAQYGPKLSALEAMVQQAGEDYLTDVAAAKGTARAVIKGARRARKPTERVFDAATGAAETAAQDVQNAFGSLGGAADPFRAVTAREQGGALTRIAESKAGALNELKQRKQEARSGRALALSQALGTLRSDVRKLQTEGANIRSQRGNYIAGQLGSLANERADRRAKAREGAASRASQEKIAGIYSKGKGKGGGGSGSGSGSSGGATSPQVKDLREEIALALSNAEKLKLGPVKTEKKDGKEVKTKLPGLDRSRAHDTLIALPKIGDTAARIALDVVYEGKLSARNVRMLRNLGYSPASLDLRKYLPGNVEARRERTRKKGWKAQQQYYEGQGG